MMVICGITDCGGVGGGGALSHSGLELELTKALRQGPHMVASQEMVVEWMEKQLQEGSGS